MQCNNLLCTNTFAAHVVQLFNSAFVRLVSNIFFDTTDLVACGSNSSLSFTQLISLLRESSRILDNRIMNKKFQYKLFFIRRHFVRI